MSDVLNAEAVDALVERIERALRASREFLNKLPLSDGASKQAVDREFIAVDLIPGALADICALAAAVRAGGNAADLAEALREIVLLEGVEGDGALPDIAMARIAREALATLEPDGEKT